MLQRIVIGWGASEGAEDAAALAEALWRPGRSQLVLARVFSPRAGAPDGLVEALGRAAGAAGALAQVVPGDSTAEGLVELAAALPADLVVVGSSHRGRGGQLLAGNVGIELIHRSPCPVAIAPRGFRRRYAPGPRVIGVGFDGSAEARAALRGAAQLALDLGAELRIVGVVESERLAAQSSTAPVVGAGEAIRCRREQLAKDTDDALARLPAALHATGALVSGDPARILAAKSAAGLDLLVVGSHRRGVAGRVVLGSVSATLVRSAACPLLVYPRDSREAALSTEQFAA